MFVGAKSHVGATQFLLTQKKTYYFVIFFEPCDDPWRMVFSSIYMGLPWFAMVCLKIVHD